MPEYRYSVTIENSMNLPTSQDVENVLRHALDGWNISELSVLEAAPLPCGHSRSAAPGDGSECEMGAGGPSMPDWAMGAELADTD